VSGFTSIARGSIVHHSDGLHSATRRKVMGEVTGPCHIVIMSNGGFGGIHARLITQLEQTFG